MLPSGLRGGGLSSPPFPFECGGTCIVAGSALGLHDDLAAARAVLGDVPVIAVNAAAKEVRAFALFSQHPERFISQRWIDHQRANFGNEFTVHGCKHQPWMGHVQYWWKEARGGGSSSWGARKVAWLMGFDTVVLCGAPLEAGPYVDYRPGQYMADQRVIDRFRSEIEADTKWHQGVRSMSGWTKEKFGAP